MMLESDRVEDYCECCQGLYDTKLVKCEVCNKLFCPSHVGAHICLNTKECDGCYWRSSQKTMVFCWKTDEHVLKGCEFKKLVKGWRGKE